ncbi:unnamed protein product [Dracunculus medinensis]|uniref:CRT-like domain-containing protein n=1 Tax=Dracunculus medinensis TaxID=318479 RepID=A0A0N4UFR8_DRAME|nr:unnamed protein product [Dracunculus medinensis]
MNKNHRQMNENANRIDAVIQLNSNEQDKLAIGFQNDNKSDRRNSGRFFGFLLALLLVITGSVNTLAAKWADNIVIDGNSLTFDHPFFQADIMFIGEMLCMVVYFVILLVQRYRWKRQHAANPSRKSCGEDQFKLETEGNLLTSSTFPTIPRFNYFLFAAPAACDVVGTSLQYLGLKLTSAASFQMLRGAVIVFTGVLSMIFLRTRLQAFRWVGIAFIVIGLLIVGVADVMFSGDEKTENTINVIFVFTRYWLRMANDEF